MLHVAVISKCSQTDLYWPILISYVSFLIHAKNEVVTNVGAKLLYVFGRIYSRSWESELLPAGIWWQLYKWCHRVQMERPACWDGCSPGPLTVTEVKTSPRLHLLFLDVARWSAHAHFCGHQGGGFCSPPPRMASTSVAVFECDSCHDLLMRSLRQILFIQHYHQRSHCRTARNALVARSKGNHQLPVCLSWGVNMQPWNFVATERSEA